MTWLRIESSVARNRKFVKAGPAPSWLWLCGLAYCQEGLTDGFIPIEALDYLGVKNARQLTPHLIKSGLWEEVDGGWRVHDYLEHNRSASEVEAIKAKRIDGGKLGGRPKKNLPDNLKVSSSKPSLKPPVESVKTQAVDVPVVAAVVGSVLGGGVEGAPPLDVWFRELVASYPAERVTTGQRTEHAFFEQFCKNSRPAADVWADMREGLANQIAGHEWRVKGMVPTLEKWLSEGRWTQRHQAAPVSTLVSERTARTLTSAEAFVRGGK